MPYYITSNVSCTHLSVGSAVVEVALAPAAPRASITAAPPEKAGHPRNTSPTTDRTALQFGHKLSAVGSVVSQSLSLSL